MISSDLLERLQNLTPSAAEGVVVALREEGVERCASNGLFFLRFVKTRDEADPESPIKPFPADKEYIRALWDIFATRQRVVVAKSRQMMVSWVLCAFCVWWARFRANQYVVWQTQREEDAFKMVSTAGGDKDTGYLGRMQFIERNLPSWLQQRVRQSEGRLNYPNGSLIEAVAGGANQVRGKVASLIVEDEFAHQAESRGVYQAVAPLIQKATKFVAVSTPNGMSNVFAQLYHGIREGS